MESVVLLNVQKKDKSALHLNRKSQCPAVSPVVAQTALRPKPISHKTLSTASSINRTANS